MRNSLGSMAPTSQANVAPFIVSILALLFTTFSFWWMNWRRGTLRVTSPATYAAFVSPEKLLVEFPFVLYNTGAIPIVVDDLRLQLPDLSGPPLGFNATVDKIGTDQERAFAIAFAVHGREAKTVICEFQRNPGVAQFRKGDYRIVLEARLDGQTIWTTLHSFPLRITEQALKTIHHGLIVHDNPL